MDDHSADRQPPITLWLFSVAVAGWGAWILFDAHPGINWVLWTTAAVAGLLRFAPRGQPPSLFPLLGLAPIAIAGAAAITTSPTLIALIVLSTVFLLATLMLLTASPSPRSITAVSTATAPLIAIALAVSQAGRRAIEATRLIQSSRTRAWVRGLVITLPILIVFALLLAGADPVFAAWRDRITALFDDWAFLPRIIFFFGLLVVVLGAYGFATLQSGAVRPNEPNATTRWFGSTERLILLTGVAALFWLFLAVQVGYLFGNLPQVPASGVTFAEFARRGFGELTLVASAAAAIVIISERHGVDDERKGALRLLTLAVIAAVFFLVGSALRRVWLYQAAYGFTTARLYAQVYMSGVAVGLALLAVEVVGGFDAGRLFRRGAVAAMILFIGLIYWNHEAWIARRNIDRYTVTGDLDVTYLTRELSPDAIPAIAGRLHALPDSIRLAIGYAVRERHAKNADVSPRPWFQWNLADHEAKRAIATSFAP